MLSFLLLCVTGLSSFSSANGDYVKFSVPAFQPDGFPPYVLIEEPFINGGSNAHPFNDEFDTDLWHKSPVADALEPGQKRCPVDGDPHCRDCVPGYKGSDFVQTQCCFAHHWAWQNKQSLRDVLPYRFHLAPVNQTEPDWERHANPGEIWHVDVCTMEPVATLPTGGYIPCRQRNACPDVRKDGTIY
ncbi:uncharacterized protein LOC129586095 [Paramacrobiotus metropolitanus]|uniref:uncharacterized protein LOC129586095 n=1 Tax=Paramacrobiotus metropolitanus TaxID=2943436 RepID=UPI0024462483|nr:uncharacterized protein LOC129586095 [Paramacrobiotus metropolitanus]